MTVGRELIAFNEPAVPPLVLTVNVDGLGLIAADGAVMLKLTLNPSELEPEHLKSIIINEEVLEALLIAALFPEPTAVTDIEVGFGHPDGISKLACELLGNELIPALNENVSRFPVELLQILAGETVVVPSPSAAFPSVNVVCAVSPEACPEAISTNDSPR